MSQRIIIKDCLWLRTHNVESQGVFQPVLRALAERGAEVLRFNHEDRSSLESLRQRLWATDKHLLVHGLNGAELQAVRPLLRDRGNYSVVFVDWWNNPPWLTQKAEYLFFPMYNGIAVRLGKTEFAPGASPNFITLPERFIPYHLKCAALRLPFWLATPALDLVKRRQRKREPADRRRLIYFPFPISGEALPLATAAPRIDVASMGDTFGAWILRDPFTPARWNFAKLYRDRGRLVDLVLRYEGNPFVVHDRRRNTRFLPWPELCQLIRETRLMVCTGGLQRASISKYLEYTCLATPMIGATLPFEFPWLDQVVFPFDSMSISADRVKPTVLEALAAAPKLKENCLNLRDRILKLYDIHEILDMAQEQIDGKPIRPGYLKSPAPF